MQQQKSLLSKSSSFYAQRRGFSHQKVGVYFPLCRADNELSKSKQRESETQKKFPRCTEKSEKSSKSRLPTSVSVYLSNYVHVCICNVMLSEGATNASSQKEHKKHFSYKGPFPPPSSIHSLLAFSDREIMMIMTEFFLFHFFPLIK